MTTGDSRGHVSFPSADSRRLPIADSGFVLLPVILLITVLAAAILLLSRQNASSAALGSREAQVNAAAFVAEAGLRHAIWKASAEGTCKDYADLVDVPFGEHRYSAKYSNTSGSPTTIMATGSLKNGVKHALILDSANTYQAPDIVTVQLGKSGGKDTLLDDFYPTRNYGGADYLQVNSQKSWIQRPVLQFDLGEIPANVAVISAQLQLKHLSTGSAGIVSVHRMNRDWVEGTRNGGGTADGATWPTYDATNGWDTAGGDFDATPVVGVQVTSDTHNRWAAFEIGSVVADWVAGKTPNFGLLMNGDGSVQNVKFASKDTSDPADAPRLVITYACQCGQTCTAAAGESKNVLLVVGDPANLTAPQTDKKTLIESWGHSVSLIATGDSQASFDIAAAGVNVVYVPELGETAMNQLDAKADNLTTGVITEESRRALLLGGFSLWPFVSADSINITDNGHYMTETLPLGSVQLSSGAQSMWVLQGTLAIDLHVLGELGGSPPGLAYLEAGELRNDSSPAPARRVKLPWGAFNFDINLLTPAALEIMKRAIEWASVSNTTSPMAHWKLDETSGTSALDSVGGHDGTLMNGPAWASGTLDGGLNFDGIDDQVNAGSAATIQDIFDGGGTLTAWIRPAGWGEGNYGRIADKSSATYPGSGWALELYGANSSFLFQIGFSGTTGSWMTPNGSVSLDSWQHVALVYDNSSDANDPVIYIDGTAQTVTELDTPSGTLLSDAGIDLMLGNHAMATVRTFDGILDDVRIYDRMLEATEVTELASAGGGGGGGSSCDGTFRDEFNTRSFAGNDGTLTWPGAWLEVGESNGALFGDIQVNSDQSNYQLRTRDNDNGGEGIERQVDLSSATSATLSYDYRRMNLDNTSDYTSVEISANGAAGPWAELTRHDGSGNDGSYLLASHDISAFISASTRIRFQTSSTMGGTDTVWFDNIEIQCSP